MSQIETALTKIFDRHRIVFWYDAKRELRAEFDGLKARVLQHEIDHLDGVLIVDRQSSLKRSLIRKEISQKRKSGEW